jgi:mRNA-degrading endonuclease RelE of RelBE toxin-antitoxin system
LQIEFTQQATISLLEIGQYLLDEKLSKQFVKKYLVEIKDGILKLLGTFPESGVPFKVDNIECRKITVNNYSVLYSLDKDKVIILLIFKQNLPHLN